MLGLLTGQTIWKSYMEYNHRGFLYGMPYYLITKIDQKGKYYLWGFDIEKLEYIHLKSSFEFDPLWKEGLNYDKKLINKLKH